MLNLRGYLNARMLQFSWIKIKYSISVQHNIFIKITCKIKTTGGKLYTVYLSFNGFKNILMDEEER